MIERQSLNKESFSPKMRLAKGSTSAGHGQGATVYPDLERGESASETGRDHIPPRLFKEMAVLDKQRVKLDELLTGIYPFNAKARAAEISPLLDRYIPAVEKMDTEMKKYRKVISVAASENAKLKKENEKLAIEAKDSTMEMLKGPKLQDDYSQARALLERIPPEVLAQVRPHSPEVSHER